MTIITMKLHSNAHVLYWALLFKVPNILGGTGDPLGENLFLGHQAIDINLSQSTPPSLVLILVFHSEMLTCCRATYAVVGSLLSQPLLTPSTVSDLYKNSFDVEFYH